MKPQKSKIIKHLTTPVIALVLGLVAIGGLGTGSLPDSYGKAQTVMLQPTTASLPQIPGASTPATLASEELLTLVLVTLDLGELTSTLTENQTKGMASE